MSVGLNQVQLCKESKWCQGVKVFVGPCLSSSHCGMSTFHILSLTLELRLGTPQQRSVESDVSDDNGMSDVEDEAPHFSCRHKS